MSQHAKLSPSGADRWMNCPGSFVLTEGIENESSEYAEEGTAAHYCAEQILKGEDPSNLVGTNAPNGVEITEDMVNDVQTYTTLVQQYAEGADIFEVEVSLSIDHLTHEPDAKGTADAVIIIGNEIQVHDLKFGRGKQVSALNNKQLRVYALAALEEYAVLGPFETVRMAIHQPRLNHFDEEVITLNDLYTFEGTVRNAVEHCRIAKEAKPTFDPIKWADQFLKPSDTTCQWCDAKATCPKLRELVLSRVVGEDLIDLTEELKPQVESAEPNGLSNAQLAESLDMVDLIESWCAAVRGRVNAELKLGNEVPGYKLVAGRRGARAWTDAAEAEEIMKSMRLKADEMYTRKVITPTQAEKVLKEKPKCWNRIKPMIVQPDGKPAVAPATDKRPALVIATEDFEDVSEEALA